MSAGSTVERYVEDAGGANGHEWVQQLEVRTRNGRPVTVPVKLGRWCKHCHASPMSCYLSRGRWTQCPKAAT